MNRKGFTLIELLVTIIVLSVVVGITIPVTLSVINNAKEKEFKLLLDNIKSAALNLSMECNSDDSLELCSYIDDTTGITLRDLALNGFLSYESGSGNRISVINPKTNENVSNCKIKVNSDGTYNNVNCSFISNEGHARS